ncbi:hypothetical protein CAAN1_13S03158 [[Candida] anglica]|uniref:MARVEL domain-containing protein n=1 Tax=[Candida] anglica TaxID=148631 RepID=A0ABP0EJ26_9ASCO
MSNCSVIKSRQTIISITIRAIQLAWTIAALVTAAISDSKLPYERIQYSLAVSVISLVYVILTVSPLYRYAVPIQVVLCEGILSLLWLVAFGLMANVWASINCDVFDTSFWSMALNDSKATKLLDSLHDSCPVNKVNIAFACLAWISFSVSFILSLACTYVPVSKGEQGLREKIMSYGALFPAATTTSATTATTNSTDPEVINFEGQTTGIRYDPSVGFDGYSKESENHTPDDEFNQHPNVTRFV